MGEPAIPDGMLAAELRRRWPREAELTELRLTVGAMRRALGDRDPDDGHGRAVREELEDLNELR
jgi:hypothetical protein